MIRSEWEGQEVYFWIPAFRVHPSLFLRLSKQMTLFQPAEKTEAVLPNALLHPVTFSEESAAASLKIHLAHLLTKKKDTSQNCMRSPSDLWKAHWYLFPSPPPVASWSTRNSELASRGKPFPYESSSEYIS